jgi:Flp pilus assembly pilin Flp
MKKLSLLSTRLYCSTAVKRQKGATIIEYVLLASLIGVLLITSFSDLRTAIAGAFGDIATLINP